MMTWRNNYYNEYFTEILERLREWFKRFHDDGRLYQLSNESVNETSNEV